MFKAFTFEGVSTSGEALLGITADAGGELLPSDAIWKLVKEADLDAPIAITGTTTPILAIKHAIRTIGYFWCPAEMAMSGQREGVNEGAPGRT